MAAQKKLAGLSSTQAAAEELERLAGEVARLSPIAIDQASRYATA
ncbi:hypothetical protein [Kozakia baliensis]|nr:hypothetical protein [Kozakia baliensis]